MSLKRKGVILVGILLVFAMIASGCNAKETSAPPEPTVVEKIVEVEKPVDSFVIHGDTINSHLIENAICVQNSRFEQGQRLVFRAAVNDVATGNLIEDAKVKVVFGTGEEYEMVMGEHGAEKTKLYTFGFTIPEDFPTGTLDIKYVAEVNGKTATFEPFNVALSKLTILAKSN